MTAQTPERDGGGETLALIAYAARYGFSDADALAEWQSEPGHERKRWLASAEAVAAHVVNPTAADYDHAAETTRLEAEIERLNGLLRDDRRSLGRIWREPQNATQIADERLTALECAGVRAEDPGEPQ